MLVPDGYKTCPVCGRLIAADAVVCKHCGANIGSPGNTPNNKNQHQSANNEYNKYVENNDYVDYSQLDDSYSVTEALTYMFIDKSFKFKATALILLNFIASMLSFSFQAKLFDIAQPQSVNDIMSYAGNFVGIYILIIAFSCISWGYVMDCLKAISQQSGYYELPSVQIFSNLLTGIKSVLAYILAVLVLLIPFFIISLIPIINIIAFICIGAFLLMLFPALVYIFAHKRWFTSFLRFKLALKLINYNTSRYFIVLFKEFLVLVGLGILEWIAIVVIMLAIKNSIIFSLLYAIMSAYMVFVMSYFNAKCLSPQCLYELEQKKG